MVNPDNVKDNLLSDVGSGPATVLLPDYGDNPTSQCHARSRNRKLPCQDCLKSIRDWKPAFTRAIENGIAPASSSAQFNATNYAGTQIPNPKTRSLTFYYSNLMKKKSSCLKSASLTFALAAEAVQLVSVNEEVRSCKSMDVKVRSCLPFRIGPSHFKASEEDFEGWTEVGNHSDGGKDDAYDEAGEEVDA
ncbi:uncharacterized protein K452DRAFT_307198 [Aplosporella prunicola CBS 121167]|uniref:Uncharacterized protein n=1 Tax=Aplosporella prunicola CBS 121167 TaxID=1176127 RepID=A0A6A6BLW7_9PEZI|nr:uncharacterized protein K452DRAFT_307198 [Aplosporella prunicola CBS 121167]KAF2143837.1 hypothetical protein K452DRAFT_307198 [Aplosporella prunicola CBS 121167]